MLLILLTIKPTITSVSGVHRVFGTFFRLIPLLAEFSTIFFQQVPILEGSNYYVDKTTYTAAKNTGSGRRFVGDLLKELFPQCVLVVSNIKGGKPKVGDKTEDERRWALHKKRRLSLTGKYLFIKTYCFQLI